MGHWNHRVVKKTVNIAGEDKVIYGVHEAYYTDEGNLENITEDPVSVYSEEGLEGLAEVMKWFVKALEAPVLNYEDVKGDIDMDMEGEAIPLEEVIKEIKDCKEVNTNDPLAIANIINDKLEW